MRRERAGFQKTYEKNDSGTGGMQDKEGAVHGISRPESSLRKEGGGERERERATPYSITIRLSLPCPSLLLICAALLDPHDHLSVEGLHLP
jgi:hypothetical protein